MPPKTSKGRPKQPKCPTCGKALYKRMDKGQVLPGDPYAWCRNTSCDSYNKDHDGGSRFKPLKGKRLKKSQIEGYWGVIRGDKAKKPPRAKPKQAKQATPDVTVEASEPAAVAKARVRIKAVISAVEEQYGVETVGLALAIVSQETGNHEAANSLIREYKLTERYGIQPK